MICYGILFYRMLYLRYFHEHPAKGASRLNSDFIFFACSKSTPHSLITHSVQTPSKVLLSNMTPCPMDHKIFSFIVLPLNSSDSPNLQHHQSHPENSPAEYNRETGKLNEDLHHSFLSDKPNYPFSSIALKKKTCCILCHPTCPYLLWIL